MGTQQTKFLAIFPADQERSWIKVRASEPIQLGAFFPVFDGAGTDSENAASVKWEAHSWINENSGTITQNGLYTAPSSVGMIIVSCYSEIYDVKGWLVLEVN
ncbi:hypothetical protein [Pseudomonas sp. GL-RE-26]|uniref:hypothetical protein n=1 Tax=Pseudomonas sp. GL-RE-26 TaxID=2832390 RepID=UPI001CC16320|nr:hypothetical protein [Pseudomonas sp. GL-RE-26]